MAKNTILEDDEVSSTSSDEVSPAIMIKKLYSEVFPKILEVEKKCDFLISNYGLENVYKKFIGAVSDNNFLLQAKSVCEFYGFQLSTLESPTHWEKVEYVTQDHIDIMIGFFQYKNIPFKTSALVLTSSK
jgi:hypothetical protein